MRKLKITLLILMWFTISVSVYSEPKNEQQVTLTPQISDYIEPITPLIAGGLLIIIGIWFNHRAK